MTVDNLLKLRQARQDAEDTLKARYSFEARIAYDNAARAFEYALSVAAEDLLKMAEAGQSHADAGLLAALEECVTVLTAKTIGTIYEDDPEWYAAIDRAVPRARAAVAAAKGADK